MEFRKKAYPLDEAVRVAAEQNFNRDVRCKLVRRSEWESERAMYEEEARHLLATSGQNYDPENGEPLIVVESWSEEAA